MMQFLKCLATAGLFAALPQAALAQGGNYPFLGTWDCGVATFAFTPSAWNNGAEDMTIQKIQAGKSGSWTLLFAGDYYFTVSDFTGDSMTWLSGESGDSLTCKRVGKR